MLTHVEHKHWYTQLPFSWGVEVMLVIALVAGTVFAATQVRGRDVTIADQATFISAQAITMQQTQQQILTERQGAYWDSALVQSYGALETHRAALARAERGEYGEVYESVAIEAAAVAETQSRIEMLLAQQRAWQMVRSSTGYDT